MVWSLLPAPVAWRECQNCPSVVRLFVLLAVGAGIWGQVNATNVRDDMANKSIEAVLAENANRLMAVDGVVGTAVGRCRGQPCIRIFVVEDSPEVRNRLPRTLDGYPVDIQETGKIRKLSPGSKPIATPHSAHGEPLPQSLECEPFELTRPLPRHPELLPHLFQA